MMLRRHAGWDVHAHRGFPKVVESTTLSRDNISREIGRTSQSVHSQESAPQCGTSVSVKSS